ncbi:MAG: TIGR01440 family protein [Clostridia bacterium]|nr:TIGR01440 family protein [Clostridia bacterium]MBQ2694573.1 TIGR01440 family protein [Clostridia bacterium]
MQNIFNQAQNAAKELIEKSGVKNGDIVVIGCSTSEVMGKKIGTSGTLETAQAIFDGLNSVFAENGIYLAAQCCEHLNRAIIIESEKADMLGLEKVCVVPHPHAGGSFATAAYHAMKNPAAVEEIKADAGIDIGSTLIGMHLKRVAVPLRLENNVIGEAKLNAARTRAKYIGGERAKYE